MDDKLKREIVTLYAQTEQAAVTALIIRDLIAKLRTLMDESALTQARLAGFREYALLQETMGPIWDPTRYRDMLHNGDFETLRAQIDLLQKLADFFQISEGFE